MMQTFKGFIYIIWRHNTLCLPFQAYQSCRSCWAMTAVLQNKHDMQNWSHSDSQNWSQDWKNVKSSKKKLAGTKNLFFLLRGANNHDV